MFILGLILSIISACFSVYLIINLVLFSNIIFHYYCIPILLISLLIFALGIFLIIKSIKNKKNKKLINEQNQKEINDLKEKAIELKILKENSINKKKIKLCDYCGAVIVDNHCTGCGAKNLK